MNVVETKSLIKRYDNKLVLDHVDMHIKEGEIVGLLGPNGAGKSTFIKCVTGITPYDSGEIRVLGSNLKKGLGEAKQYIGVVPQELSLYPNISAYANVKFFASLYGYKGKELEQRVKRALTFTALWEQRNKRPKVYSGGMKRRLNIACAIAHEPKLIILDEPTVGIDAQSRNHILESVKQLNEEGATIIYTSHYMEEVETICKTIKIIDQGRVIANGTKDEILKLVQKENTIMFELGHSNYQLVEEIKKINGVKEASLIDGKLLVVSEASNIDEIVLCIKRQNINIYSINMQQCSLEDVFLTLTSKKLRD